jgi:hypothetical protein
VLCREGSARQKLAYVYFDDEPRRSHTRFVCDLFDLNQITIPTKLRLHSTTLRRAEEKTP